MPQAASAGLAPVGVYATFVEPFMLEVERSRLEVGPERRGSQPLRVAVLADLQTADPGGHEREAVERLMRLRPDLILIPGDVYQGHDHERDLPEIRRLMAGLSAPGGAFFVPGDADTAPEWERVFAGTRVRVLVDEVAAARARDRVVTVGGIRNDYRSPEAARVIEELERRRGGDVRILLAHRPDAALLTRAGGRIDLTVAGIRTAGRYSCRWSGRRSRSRTCLARSEPAACTRSRAAGTSTSAAASASSTATHRGCAFAPGPRSR